AAAIAIPSDAWGETPLGLAVLREGAGVSADQLLEWVNARVGKMQRLSAVELRPSLPGSAAGKLLKQEVRQPYWPARQSGRRGAAAPSEPASPRRRCARPARLLSR